MAETFVAANLVLPGTYIRVRADGLIGVRGISAGNIGIVGPASTGTGSNVSLSTVAEPEAAFGDAGALNLTAMIGELYRNGARIVHARAVSDATDQTGLTAAFNELIKEDVQILVAPSLPTATALAVLPSVVESAETNNQDLIAVIGADGADAAAVAGQAVTSGRVVMTAPGYRVFNPADP
jgi:hypothetical protein